MFAAFVREHQPALTAHVARIYPEFDPHVVVADVFAIAWRRFADIPIDRAERWLKATAHNAVRNMRRSDARWRLLQNTARDAARTQSAAVDDESRLEAEIVITALAHLSVDDRDLLRLQAVDGPSSEELASILGISPAAARTRLSRARQRLHDECERLSEEGPR
jgi:RNA polymerase sigma-70 factor (ECF subfamily)